MDGFRRRFRDRGNCSEGLGSGCHGIRMVCVFGDGGVDEGDVQHAYTRMKGDFSRAREASKR